VVVLSTPLAVESQAVGNSAARGMGPGEVPYKRQHNLPDLEQGVAGVHVEERYVQPTVGLVVGRMVSEESPAGRLDVARVELVS
jgi:hypothetical protein